MLRGYFLSFLVWCYICILLQICKCLFSPYQPIWFKTRHFLLIRLTYMNLTVNAKHKTLTCYTCKHTHTVLTCFPHHTFICTDLTHAWWQELAHTRRLDIFIYSKMIFIVFGGQIDFTKESFKCLCYPVNVCVQLFIVHGFFWLTWTTRT